MWNHENNFFPVFRIYDVINIDKNLLTKVMWISVWDDMSSSFFYLNNSQNQTFFYTLICDEPLQFFWWDQL